VFTARYALNPYIKQIRFVFKGLMTCRLQSSNQTVLIILTPDMCHMLSDTFTVCASHLSDNVKSFPLFMSDWKKYVMGSFMTRTFRQMLFGWSYTGEMYHAHVHNKCLPSVRNPLRKRPVAKARHGWENNIRTVIKETREIVMWMNRLRIAFSDAFFWTFP
jgi:hypothetical protein